VNKQPGILEQANVIDDVGVLKGYELVLLTGGEPMLYPTQVEMIAHTLHAASPAINVFLYTAILSESPAFHWLDGINFTVHSPVKAAHVFALSRLDEWVQDHPEKSCRLMLDPNIDQKLSYTPSVWYEVRMKHWFTDGECRVPAHEDLFILESAL
jgi:organic radical activating enzyme